MSEYTTSAVLQAEDELRVLSAYAAKAYAAKSPVSGLAMGRIPRRDPRPRDVQIEILYCGVCRSDLQQIRNEWESVDPTVYPCVPGHEIVGRVMSTGSAVKKFREGDMAAVGHMAGSCGVCLDCSEGLEQYCEQFPVLTSNGPDKFLGGVTYGGYSDSIVVDEAFTLRLSGRVDPARTAPLLCAGITTYSPLRHWNVGPGMKVGVVGLGGLGHMALKFANAFGAEVVLFTTSPDKAADALFLGAHEVVLSKNEAEMRMHAGSFDFILDTVSADHDLNVYLSLLKRDGTLALVGVPPNPARVSAFGLILGRRQLAGSVIGGIRETQEMLDFCAERGITADIELIRLQQINEAYERLLRGDVRYRFVIDMASLR